MGDSYTYSVFHVYFYTIFMYICIELFFLTFMKRWIFIFALVVGLASCGEKQNSEAVRRAKFQTQILKETEADMLGNSIKLSIRGKDVRLFRGMGYDDVTAEIGQPDKGGMSINTGEIRSESYEGGKVTLMFTLDVLTDWIVMP